MAQTLKNLPAMQEIWVRSLGWEDPLEKGMATHSSICAWRIPWTEEPGGLQSTGFHRAGHEWSNLAWMHTTLIVNHLDLLLWRYFEHFIPRVTGENPLIKIFLYIHSYFQSELLFFTFLFLFVSLTTLWSMRDLSSLTRDWTMPPSVEAQSFDHWATR